MSENARDPFARVPMCKTETLSTIACHGRAPMFFRSIDVADWL